MINMKLWAFIGRHNIEAKMEISRGKNANNNQVPVTVLTSFLSAGKTTLLNRILTEQLGQKYAVFVNEFGEEGIDNDLLQAMS